MPVPSSVGRSRSRAAFLRDLTEHATSREFVYSHSWRRHDLVVWDNRTVMHRARRFDRNEVRDMRRTTLGGEVPIVARSSVRRAGSFHSAEYNAST